MKHHTAEFVLASDIFADYPEVWENWQYQSDHTFGNNNRSLVTPDSVLAVLKATDHDQDGWELIEARLNVIVAQAKNKELYIDLEN